MAADEAVEDVVLVVTAGSLRNTLEAQTVFGAVCLEGASTIVSALKSAAGSTLRIVLPSGTTAVD